MVSTLPMPQDRWRRDTLYSAEAFFHHVLDHGDFGSFPLQSFYWGGEGGSSVELSREG